MPVVDGFVENMKIKVLRDTGRAIVVERRHLVEIDKLMRIYKMCILLDGTVRKFPVARISIRSPYYVGECEALYAENPVYDLILGNIPETRNPNDSDLFWDKDEHPHMSEVVDVVRTRAQKAQEGKGTFLQVPSAISGVDKEEVV